MKWAKSTRAIAVVTIESSVTAIEADITAIEVAVVTNAIAYSLKSSSERTL